MFFVFFKKNSYIFNNEYKIVFFFFFKEKFQLFINFQ